MSSNVANPIGNITFPPDADMNLTDEALNALSFLGVTMALRIDSVKELDLVSSSKFEIIMHGFTTSPGIEAEHKPDDHRLDWTNFERQFRENIIPMYDEGRVRRRFGLLLVFC